MTDGGEGGGWGSGEGGESERVPVSPVWEEICLHAKVETPHHMVV